MASHLGQRHRTARTLTIDPRIRRIGFAFFEAAILHDWGVRTVRSDVPSTRVHRLLIPILVKMLDRYEPTALLVPDVRSGAVRRSAHVRDVIEGIVREALNRGIVVSHVTTQQIREAFRTATGRKRPNQQAVNRVMAEWFKELRHCLPRTRRVYDPEQHFEPMFVAVAMYCTWQGVPAARERSVTPSKESEREMKAVGHKTKRSSRSKRQTVHSR